MKKNWKKIGGQQPRWSEDRVKQISDIKGAIKMILNKNECEQHYSCIQLKSLGNQYGLHHFKLTNICQKNKNKKSQEAEEEENKVR